jgi:hypothetical protein
MQRALFTFLNCLCAKTHCPLSYYTRLLVHGGKHTHHGSHMQVTTLLRELRSLNRATRHRKKHKHHNAGQLLANSSSPGNNTNATAGSNTTTAVASNSSDVAGNSTAAAALNSSVAVGKSTAAATLNSSVAAGNSSTSAAAASNSSAVAGNTTAANANVTALSNATDSGFKSGSGSGSGSGEEDRDSGDPNWNTKHPDDGTTMDSSFTSPDVVNTDPTREQFNVSALRAPTLKNARLSPALQRRITPREVAPPKQTHTYMASKETQPTYVPRGMLGEKLDGTTLGPREQPAAGSGEQANGNLVVYASAEANDPTSSISLLQWQQ